MATSGRGATVITDRGGQRASTAPGRPRVHLRWLDAAAALEARRAWIGSRPFGTGCGVLGSAKVGECVCVLGGGPCSVDQSMVVLPAASVQVLFYGDNAYASSKKGGTWSSLHHSIT